MNITRVSTKNPAAVLVLSLLLLVFGILAINKLPIQLLPDVDRPTITVFNGWRAVAPAEMESTIVEPQENVLRNVPGVTEISSNIGPGFGRITLTFEVGQPMQEAMLNVINALNQTPPLPREANEPRVIMGSGRGNVASILLKKLDPQGNNDFTPYQKLISDTIEPRLRSIPGVSQVSLESHLPKQLHITFDPYKMAALGISIGELSNKLGRASDVSGGFAEVGRRRYTVRFEGQFDADSYGQMIVSYNQGRPVYLNEIAEVKVGYADKDGFTRRNGLPGYYITMQRTHDSNTVDILDRTNIVLDELNTQVLHAQGLELELSFDASVHIRRAIALVNSNLAIGIALALLILYLFLRGWKATLMIAMTIPASLMVAFVVLDAFGRSLNVVSLAGLAFAVGLVLDAAIIVQENIVRMLQSGTPLMQAVRKGTAQVSGALFASTATTVAIFVPVLFMQGVEGQLFYDLAMTLAVAVVASLVTALSLIPVASMFWLKAGQSTDIAPVWHKLAKTVETLTHSRARALVWVTGLLPGSLLVIYLLLPQADFLPEARSDGIFASFNLPPGGNLEVLEEEIGQLLVERLQPYYEEKQYPAIRGYNIAMYSGFNILFIYPEDPRSGEDMVKLLNEKILVDLPDTQSYVGRGSLLNFGFNSGRALFLDFQGPDSDALIEQVREAMPKVRELLPNAMVRPIPGLALAQPELKLLPNERNIAQAGTDRITVANAVRAITDGLYVGEQFDGNERMDIILKGQTWDTPEALQAMPLFTPGAGVQTLGQLTDMQRTTGPTSLVRINGLRTMSLQITPGDDMPLEQAMEILKQDLMQPLRQTLPSDMGIQFRGSADRLEQAMSEMGKNFVIAVFILFLLMSALFKSPKDSLLVLLSMPMALAGGVIALWLLNLFSSQALDLLTMIGFIILMGLVVNNAILMVDQTRQNQAAGLSLDDSLFQAVLTRARPVYMSTFTSIFGMLPLALVPGVGSEIYRGLAAVIVGGMCFSALFTLLLMPALIRLFSFKTSAQAEKQELSHVA